MKTWTAMFGFIALLSGCGGGGTPDSSRDKPADARRSIMAASEPITRFSAADLDGDGRDDLIGEARGLTRQFWLMNGSTVKLAGNFYFTTGYEDPLTPVQLPYGQVVARADFDGDGIADTLVLNGQAAYGYDVHFTSKSSLSAIWLAPTSVLPVNAATDLVTSVTPATADRGAIVMVWRGVTQASLMPSRIDRLTLRHDGSIVQVDSVPGVKEGNLWPAAVGDFDGDGRMDELVFSDFQEDIWQPASLYVLLNRASTPVLVKLALEPQAWDSAEMPLVGDFDGDGRADILLPGSHKMLLMDGTAIRSSRVIAFPADGTGWRPAAVADLDGDGKEDVIWHDAATGRWAASLMNGTDVKSAGLIFQSADYTLNAVADVDGDGKSDLIWLRTDVGRVVVWLMDGLVKKSATVLVEPNPSFILTSGEMASAVNILSLRPGATQRIVLNPWAGSTP